MQVFHVQVDFADGNDFSHVQSSHVAVLAKSALDAKLLASQMAMIPQPGKPDHIQLLGAVIA